MKNLSFRGFSVISVICSRSGRPGRAKMVSYFYFSDLDYFGSAWPTRSGACHRYCSKTSKTYFFHPDDFFSRQVGMLLSGFFLAESRLLALARIPIKNTIFFVKCNNMQHMRPRFKSSNCRCEKSRYLREPKFTSMNHLLISVRLL